jgi:hypothetical protein
MIKNLLLSCTLLASIITFAQRTMPEAEKARLQITEDTLHTLGNQLLDDTVLANRMRSDSFFTRALVRALRAPYSFYYTFDSVETLTIIYPPDSTFRILTWEYYVDEQNFRQKGAIQKNTPDGSLSLIPLFDASEYTENPNDSVRQSSNWIGAIYYKIIQKEYNGKKYYTLLGYDENGYRSTKKWLDVLTFNAQGQPQFGGNYFRFDRRDSLWTPGWQRFNIEYKKEGRGRLMYDEEKDLILFDHLVSESNEPEKKYSYIPDGDYEGLKWEAGKWVHNPNPLQGLALGDGNEPRPDLLMNDNGEVNEGKLDQQSEMNASKKVEAKQIKKKAKVEIPATKRKG